MKEWPAPLNEGFPPASSRQASQDCPKPAPHPTSKDLVLGPVKLFHVGVQVKCP